MKKKVIVEIEELFILLLIFLSLIEFFDMLPSDLDFIKKIISWTILGFLLYSASITKLFFGDRHKLVDIGLILAFFMMLIKNVVLVAASLLHKGGIFSEIYRIIFENIWIIERAGFLLGTAFVILFSLFLTLNLHVKKPSILHILHNAGKAKTLKKKAERFLIIFIVLNAFFILVFNLLMEWLAIIVDSALVLLTVIVLLIIFARKHSHKFDSTRTLFIIGSSAEEFYEKFIGLFHNKKRIYLGFSGLLVLHLLTDVSVYLLPYIFSFQEVIYFGEATAMELGLSVWALFKEQVAGAQWHYVLSMVYVYTFNMLAMLILMISPAYIWWKVYKKKGFKVTHTELAIFFSSVVALILAPIFIVKTITTQGLIGVSILTIPMDSMLGPVFVTLLSILIGLVVFAMSYSHRLKEALLMVSLAGIMTFFTLYIYQYFVSNAQYYTQSIELLWGYGYYYIALYFGLFFVIVSLAYIGGWLIFLSETKKEYKYIK